MSKVLHHVIIVNMLSQQKSSVADLLKQPKSLSNQAFTDKWNNTITILSE